VQIQVQTLVLQEKKKPPDFEKSPGRKVKLILIQSELMRTSTGPPKCYVVAITQGDPVANPGREAQRTIAPKAATDAQSLPQYQLQMTLISCW
jgi:hypothetical protein